MGKLDEVKARILHLTSEIRRHQDLYYIRARPEISDREYDVLFDELLALEKEYPQFAFPDSPTKRVGSDLDNIFPEIPHPAPMLSLDKVYTVDELDKWIEKTRREAIGEVSFVLEEKVDGSTIVLHYEEGVLARAVTRGDGYVGNDITENVRTIRDIPLRLTQPVTSVFRGEIYINKSDFEKLNAEMDNIYANPRNFAAGNLRRKKSSEVANIPLRSFVYEGLGNDPGTVGHIRVLHRLVELGFRVSTDVGFFCSDAHSMSRYSELFKAHESWTYGDFRALRDFVERKMEEQGKLPYEVDGLVVKVNGYRLRERLGHTAHHPRWAMAFKFEAPQAVSEILGIDVQIGRTGRVTPVARIKPVWISGSTVSNVTLHNQDYITALDAAIGDKVAVSKRGDVIPAVEEVLEKNDRGNRTFILPEDCPVCNAKLVEDGAHHFCPNKQCPARVFGRLSFFVARGQMDIANLGSETIKRLLELGLVRDIPDLYTFNPDELLEVEGFGEKKVRLIREGILKSRQKPFAAVLTSLGLDELGPRVVETLIDGGFDSMDKLIEAAAQNKPELFTCIHGIGSKTAERIIKQLRDPFILGIIEGLRKAGLNFSAEIREEKEKLPQVFAGQVWCVTGSFEHFKPREEAMEEVKKRGGRVTSSVTGATTHLLVGENPGSKLDKAKEYGTKIVSEDEFLRMLEG